MVQAKSMNFKAIEKKWQKKWEKAKIFEPEPNKRKKFFVTFPYPYQNGPAHLGHAFTFLRCDFFARYKRMKGFNVLFPQGWHATGGPIVVAALRLTEGDEKQISVLKDLGIKDSEIKKFYEPKNWVKYFTKLWRQNFESLGGSVDWRREFFTTYLNPAYSKFIQWQYTKLKEKGCVVKGSHAVVWCPKEQKVVGDHDRPDEFAGVNPEEVVIIKFRDSAGRVYPCTTFRLETIYGVTNIWINPEKRYAEIKVGSETWVVSEESVKEVEGQKGRAEVRKIIAGRDLLSQSVINPVTGSSIPVLPAGFVDPAVGTGVVMSVPAHAPYDYAALKDLGSSIKPISLIAVEGYGEFPAAEICERMGILNQKETEKLDKATKEIYAAEFHKGVLKGIFGKYAGLKVSETKEKMIDDFVRQNAAEKYYIVPQVVMCRCGARTHINIILDQWLLKYSDKSWKEKAHKAVDKIKFYPEEVRKNFHSTLDWLQDWACTHKHELGTPLPWDNEWVVESLSDSTIYMAYYTIAKYLEHAKKYGIKIQKIGNEFFDFVFLGIGNIDKVSKNSGLKKQLLKQIRDEFLYWYPVDFRNSAKELSFNHLPFFIFHHTAIFPEKFWPKGIALNGWVLIEGEKMSKSKGNFITVSEAMNKWGADVTRLAEAYAGSPGTDDPNIDLKFVDSAKRIIERLYNFSVKNYNKGTSKKSIIDKWFRSILSRKIIEITKLMDETRFKEAVGKMLEMQNDLNWYLRRAEKPNKMAISEFIENQALILSPFIPHICEEIWQKLGKKNFASLAKWPKVDEKLIDKTAEHQESLVIQTLNDINEIKKIIKKEPKQINIYVAEDWKYKIYKITQKKPKNLIAEIIKIPEIKKQGERAVKYAQMLMKKSQLEKALQQKEEYAALKSAEKFFSQELGCKVSVQVGGKNEKAQRAEPGKPGIEIL